VRRREDQPGISKGNDRVRSPWIVTLDVLAVAVYAGLILTLLFRIGTASQNVSARLVFAWCVGCSEHV